MGLETTTSASPPQKQTSIGKSRKQQSDAMEFGIVFEQYSHVLTYNS